MAKVKEPRTIVDPETGELLDHDDWKKREHPDPVPVAPPVGYKASPSMVERIRAMVRQELSREADARGFESFEEAEDFEVDEEVEISTPYEEVFEPPVVEEQESRPASEAPNQDRPPADPGSEATPSQAKGKSDKEDQHSTST